MSDLQKAKALDLFQGLLELTLLATTLALGKSSATYAALFHYNKEIYHVLLVSVYTCMYIYCIYMIFTCTYMQITYKTLSIDS